MRSRWCVFLCVGLGLPCAGAAGAAPELPPAEQAVQDTADHWGLAFSDQYRLFGERFRAFESAVGRDGLGYVLGIETALRKTFPDKYCFKGRLTSQVELRAARNESEAFQLAVLPRPGLELHGVRVTASDFVRSGQSGPPSTIPADAVHLWRVGFVETKTPPYPTRHVGRWPDPLLELEPFSITGLDLGLVWCEVKVPKDAAPGDYVGTVEVTAENAAPLAVTVNLHVWDFALPDRIDMPMLVWTRENAGEEFLRTAELLLAHHIDPISVGRNMNLAELDDALAFCIERGLTHFQTPPVKDAESFRPYYDHIKQRGWLDKALVYGAHDEPLEEQFNEIVVPKTAEIRRDFPGLRVFLAGEYFDGMKRGTDVMLIDLSTNFHEWLDAGRPGEQELWWYFCGIPIRANLRRCLMDAPRMLIDRDAVEHRIVYWLAYHYGVQGMFIYAGDRWPAGNEKWPEEPFKMNEAMHYPYAGLHNGDGFIIYPGPRPSIRLKTLRDGAEDYWYLCEMSRLAGLPATRDRARALLDGIAPAVFVDTHYFNRRPEALLECRRALGSFIEQAAHTP
ncbi:MAG: DUF4091 domain-containing protein [Candidatus Hydrogenedentes bacterium]|nr:DUF4091 domain-containing protein [Candidatus Hydrogenedentota bacterium]